MKEIGFQINDDDEPNAEAKECSVPSRFLSDSGAYTLWCLGGGS